jgi:hypothetical protein
MEMTKEMILGVLLGRRQAYSAVAARCSAAEVLHMKEIRDSKVYLELCPDWESFCATHLHMSDDTANRQIRLLENYGPTYFDIAQLTRISPATYRAIAPAIEENKLNYNGEAIALIPENAEKVSAAVAEMRKTITVKPAPEPPPPPDPVPTLQQRCIDLTLQIEEARRKNHRVEVRAALLYLLTRIDEIERAL